MKIKKIWLLPGIVTVLNLISCSGDSGTDSASATPPKAAYLNQAWSEQDRADYYWTSQGSALISYDIYLALQLANSSELFSSAANADRMGLLLDDLDSKNNPDNLPIGVTKTIVSLGQFTGVYMGLSCAACHTSQLQYQGKQIRIDGGVGNRFTIVPWLSTLSDSLNATVSDQSRFQALLKTIQKSSAVDEADLRRRLQDDAAFVNNQINNLFRVINQPGPGRMDALGSIHNTMAWVGTANLRNLYSTTAPVKPPFLWNAPQSSWVQWSGVAPNPLSRNIGESLGVFARFDLSSNSTDQGLFDTTSDVRGLVKIENLLRRLAPPKWPETIFGALDLEKIKAGEKLYAENCSGCHASYPYRWTSPRGTSGKKFIDNKIIPQSVVGTDNEQLAGVTFSSTIKIIVGSKLASVLGLSTEELSLNYQQAVQTNILNKAVSKAGISTASEEYDNITSYTSKMSEGQPPLGYKAAPRDGVWATAPFLHNASVPNLYELLSPASERSKKFFITREFDPIKVGINTSVGKPSDFLLDTTLVGNSNAGHSFEAGSGRGIVGREFTPAERFALIEYLKSIPNVEGRVTPYGGF
jgi:hypothetical protein